MLIICQNFISCVFRYYMVKGFYIFILSTYYCRNKFPLNSVRDFGAYKCLAWNEKESRKYTALVIMRPEFFPNLRVAQPPVLSEIKGLLEWDGNQISQTIAIFL